jgi:hypothetical protein
MREKMIPHPNNNNKKKAIAMYLETTNEFVIVALSVGHAVVCVRDLGQIALPLQAIHTGSRAM